VDEAENVEESEDILLESDTVTESPIMEIPENIAEEEEKTLNTDEEN
jgi:hypothetical protein